MKLKLDFVLFLTNSLQYKTMVGLQGTALRCNTFHEIILDHHHHNNIKFIFSFPKERGLFFIPLN